jgi:ligand-binding sensor domain-containing protein
MHRLLSLSIALFGVCAFARAAPPPSPPQFATLTVADGLPSTAVYRVAQDHDGFIWIASHDGLARADGVDFASGGMIPRTRARCHPTTSRRCSSTTRD